MMNSGGLGSYPEHHFRKAIPGDIETVRRKLCDVLEDFNYVVLGENPVQARRSPQRNIIAANVLEYDTRLTIALKSNNPASTVATFNYEVQYIFSKGDRVALEREADAIIALATAPMKKSVCPACDTENAGAVRFCRACGTPISRNKLPAELEVMRLMAGVSGAYVEIAWGLAIALLTLLVAVPMILIGKPKGVIAGWAILTVGELISAFFILFALWRLRRMISPAQAARPEAQLDMPRATAERGALPPPPVSITEGTTELIGQAEQAPASVRSAKDTDSM